MSLLSGGSVATVFVDVEGDLTKFTSDVKKSAGVVQTEMGGAFGRAGKVAGTALLAGSAGAVGTALSQFTGFERGMNEVFTLIPGESQKMFDSLTGQTKDFAKEFGVLPTEAIPALYDSISSGVPVDNVFGFLETANKFSKAGAVDLGVAVDGLTTGVNAFGLEMSDAGRVSDSLFTAVVGGTTTVDELAGSLFQVAPIAGSMGVQIESVSAALTTLTQAGTPTSVAATQLKGAISELGKSGTKAAKAFEGFSGDTFPDFIENGGSFAEAAELMAVGADEAGLSVLDLFGSIDAGQAILGITGEKAEKFAEQIEAQANAAGATQVAFERMEQGLAPVLDKLKAQFAVVAIELGTTLAPAIEQVGGVALELASFFGELPGPVLATTVAAAGFTGGLLVMSGPILRTIQILKMMNLALLANPYVLIAAAVVGLGVVIYKNWDEISMFLDVTLGAIGGFFQTNVIEPVQLIRHLFESLPGVASDAWNSFVESIRIAVVEAKRLLGELRDAADRALGPIDEIIGGAAKLGGGIISAGAGLLGFDDGGVVPGPTGAPRLVLAHAGETILPTHKEPGAGSGGGVVLNVTMPNMVVRSEEDVVSMSRRLHAEVQRSQSMRGKKAA